MAFKDQTEQWISDMVPGRSFVDIGGIGVDSTNERVACSTRAGASTVAMADIRPFDYYEWATFDKLMAEQEITGYDRYDNIDINDPQLAMKLPTFDLVHCAGIFYHLANPVLALHNIRQVVGEHLIINTITIPDVVENEMGRLAYPGNTALFLPGIAEDERKVLEFHYRKKFDTWDLDDYAPRLDDTKADMPYFDGKELSCWPHWWLFTDAAFRSLARVMRFEILDEWKWHDHALFLRLKKIQ